MLRKLKPHRAEKETIYNQRYDGKKIAYYLTISNTIVFVNNKEIVTPSKHRWSLGLGLGREYC